MEDAGGCEWTKIFCFKHRLRIYRYFGAGAPGGSGKSPFYPGARDGEFFTICVGGNFTEPTVNKRIDKTFEQKNEL